MCAIETLRGDLFEPLACVNTAFKLPVNAIRCHWHPLPGPGTINETRITSTEHDSVFTEKAVFSPSPMIVNPQNMWMV